MSSQFTLMENGQSCIDSNKSRATSCKSSALRLSPNAIPKNYQLMATSNMSKDKATGR